MNIRKFGIKYCDLPTMIGNINTFLRILTVNIDSRNKKPIPTIFYILTFIALGCYFYVYTVSMIWFVFWRCAETGDLVAASIVLSLGIPSEIGTVKLIYMSIYQKRIRHAVSLYLACDSDNSMGRRFKKNLMVNLRSVKRRAMVFWLVLMVNAVAYIARPILTPGRHLSQNVIVIYGLEPMFESPNYEIASIMMAIGVLFVCFPPACIAGFIFILHGYTESQVLALSEEILRLLPDAINYHTAHFKTNLPLFVTDNFCNNRKNLNTSEHEVVNKFIRNRLRDIIRKHCVNISLGREMQSIFRVPITIGFLLLVLGLITELLGGLENTYLQVPFALMQLAMDCYAGQKLMDANAVFENAIYNSHWERFDVRNQKIILMMLQCSRTTLSMSVGELVTLSFSCLMSVLKSIYSSYTALRSVVKKT